MKKDSKPVLLDVNVLLALGWESHPFHSVAIERMERQHGTWFTCTISQLGFIRLSANPAVTKAVVSASQAARLLARMTRDAHHQFASEVVPAENSSSMGAFERVLGSQQITDAYLLTLSAYHGACFLTFDNKLAPLAQNIAELEVLQPRLK
jgi:toxin-antitoxin system PIN domain toxin